MRIIEALGGPQEIADGIYWVGRHSEGERLRCNPFMVLGGDEALLVDGGSRADFPAVMTQIFEAGIDPAQIRVLVYQHCDPDLCGSMQNMVEMCGGGEPVVLVAGNRIEFFKCYLHGSKHHLLTPMEGTRFTFPLGPRVIHFLRIPFCHEAGSTATFDPATRTLFSSDLFGTYSNSWDLEAEFPAACAGCDPTREACSETHAPCAVAPILAFHRSVMPCEKALRYSIQRIRELEPVLIAPQHGSLIRGARDIAMLLDKLEALEGVGIDGIV